MKPTAQWLHGCEIINQDRPDDPPMYYVTTEQAEARDREKFRAGLVAAKEEVLRVHTLSSQAWGTLHDLVAQHDAEAPSGTD